MHNQEINPEDIFLDSANLPGLNRDRFEGRMERPIKDRTFTWLKTAIVLAVVLLSGKLWSLQVTEGENYIKVSEENRLTRSVIFADRGIIYDRHGVPLAENSTKSGENDFAARRYAKFSGLSSILGYVKYPSKDSSGIYYDESYHGQAGVEKQYDGTLSGQNGSKLTETNAKGHFNSESIVEAPKKGEDLHLSIDAKVTESLYKAISATARERGFTGGAGVIIDTRTGEILALTSFPEYSSNVITEGSDSKEIVRLLTDKNKPFLNRAVSGLYTPGSIVKPIVALGALNENIIDPNKKILSTGSISIPNPYDAKNPSIFKDWKAHGLVDMRTALAVSSDVYFYEVGGGFEDQKGLGISKLDQYFSLFGLNEKTGIDLPAEAQGYIATPAWKEKNFPDDPVWRIGNTYHTAIGQYGTQVTPISATRWTAAIANGGILLKPTVLFRQELDEINISRMVELPASDWQVVKEGMRQAVTNGIAGALYLPQVALAAKSGTAELGTTKALVNSWITGFFPYKNPRYAFAVVMERGPAGNVVGATYVMNQVLNWMTLNSPEYLK